MDKNKLTGEFEIEAKWFSDDSKNAEYGILKYSQNSIVVELPDSDMEFDRKFRTVIGENQKNIISLFNVRVISESNKYLNKTKLLADFMFIDKKAIDSLEDFKIDSIQWSTDNLPLFLNDSAWEGLSEGEGVKYSEIPKREYKIQNLDATISINYSYITKSQITSEGLVNTFKTIPYFSIKYSKVKSILEIKEDVQKICNLICILSGAPQVISTFKYSSTEYDLLGKKMPVKSQFYFSQGIPSQKKYQKIVSAYKFDLIANNFGDILSKYFEEHGKLQAIIQHLTLLISYKNLLESSYVDAITSLEAFHTELYGDDKKITLFTQDIIMKLKAETKEAYKDKKGNEKDEEAILLTYIKKVKKITLKERLVELFDLTPVKLKQNFKHHKINFLIDEDKNEFTRKSVKTRNHLAHGNSQIIFTFDEMLSATYILSMIAECCLMKRIGLDEELITEGIFNTRIYRNYIK